MIGYMEVSTIEDVERDYDDIGEYCDIDMLTKTGRHFDEVEELLKKMGEKK